MTNLAAALAAVAVAIALSAASVDLLGDRELFVPPPDAVAEGFVRSVLEGRRDPARAYVSRPVEDGPLRALRERFRAAGEPSSVDAKTTTRDASHAVAVVEVSSASRSARFEFQLQFDTEWKIVPRW